MSTQMDASAEAFKHVGDMENPIATIRYLMVAMRCLAENLSCDEAGAIHRLAWMAMEECEAIEVMRGGLFRLTHPSREQFEKNGWPA